MTGDTVQGETTLKETITVIRGWLLHLFSYWKTLLLVGFLGGLLGIGYAWLKKPQYDAEMVFVLQENKGGSMSMYSGIASQLGIALPGSEGSGAMFTGDNFIELVNRKTIVERTLLRKVQCNGKEELLVNIYLDLYNLRKNWEENPKLQALTFKEGQDLADMTREQDSVLTVVYESLKQQNLSLDKVNRKASFLSLHVKSIDEEFSKVFAESLMNEVSEFYVQTQTKKQSETVRLLQNRTDSVKNALDAALYGGASFADQNLNLVSQSARVTSVKRQRDVQVLNAMYVELVKNLELAKFTLLKEQPLVQIIDRPSLPLKVVKLGKAKSAILGAFLLVFIVGGGLIIRDIYRRIMSN